MEAVFDNLSYLLWGTFPQGPLAGLALTLCMAVASVLLSAALGVIGGVLLAVTHGLLNALLVTAIGLFRAVPVLMLIFWTYFLLPVVLQVNVPGAATVICALGLIGGAYLSHSVYAGVRAVGQAQMQAGLSLGFTRNQSLRYLILPQAFRIMSPSFVNQWVSLIKDTSLAYIVGVPELSFLANQVNSRVMVYPLQIYITVGLIYLAICVLFQMTFIGVLRRFLGMAASESTEPARAR